MPEVEYLLYPTSVLENKAGALFSNPNNILGAPDGNTIVYSGSNNAYIRAAYDASAIPDASAVVNLKVGLRGQCDTTNGVHSLDLCDAAGVKVKGSPTFQPPTGSSPATIGTTELEIVDRTITPAQLKTWNLKWLTAQSGSPNKRSEGDSMWLRVLTWDEAFQVSQGYASSSVGGNWTNQANAVGAPNGTYATLNSFNNGVWALPAINLPADAKVYRVFIGARHKQTAVGRYLTATLNAGDTVAKDLKVTTANLDTDSEAELNAALMTKAVLASGTLQVTVATQSTSGTSSLDAVWLRVQYYVPTVARAKRWSGSAWVDAPIKRWDGSQWVTTTVKRWDGSAWV